MPEPKKASLVNAPDDVLRAAIELETLHSFQLIVGWIKDCLAQEEQVFPLLKDEVESRWNQGRASALRMIQRSLTQGRDILQNREKNRFREQAFSPNV